ncbi:Protein kinase domain-containing protein [Aphelenchoides fujianensis]|nr:Protein kinase domain-containing protein [Aphelenchoides fujianensis]
MAAVAANGAEVLPQEGETLKTRKYTYEVRFSPSALSSLLQIIKLLGKGGFGAVFEIKRKDEPKLHFAAKCETYDVKKPVLSMDCRVLRGALQIQSPHFCAIVDRGKMPERFRYIREFAAILGYLDTLAYHSIPDYDYIFYCINSACKTNNIKPDTPLDWDPGRKYAGPAKADRDKRLALVVDDAAPDPHDETSHKEKEKNTAKEKKASVSAKK